TVHVDFDELTAMASEHTSSGPALHEMTLETISSGLVRTSSPLTSYVPPSRNDWHLLFQLIFDELLNPPPSVVNQAPEVIAPIAEVIPPVHNDSTGLPSSTTVDQDAPSQSKTHTTTKIQSSAIPQDVGVDNLDMEVAHMGNDPLFSVPIPEYQARPTEKHVHEVKRIFQYLRGIVHREYQLEDLFTKALGQERIEFLINKLGMRSFMPETLKTMATIIEQQVALDEALVPSTQRLRIGRSNFRLPSDIQSKESNLQVVYDVLRRCPFFKAFLVTAYVPEIYMQEF
nr:hypothetical protein [Tanacetum cinerariifolium]